MGHYGNRLVEGRVVDSWLVFQEIFKILGEGSDVKLKVTLDVLDHKKCVDVYRSSRVALRDTQLCAGGKEDKDTCRGDSGGPLMRSVDGNYYLIGVISWGATQCGTKGIPALYTNVAMFVDWIENHLE